MNNLVPTRVNLTDLGPSQPQAQPPKQHNTLLNRQLSTEERSPPDTRAPLRIQTLQNQAPAENSSPSLAEKKSLFSPFTTAPKAAPERDLVVQPIYAKRAKNRFAIDDSDSEADSTPTQEPSRAPPAPPVERDISPPEEEPAAKSTSGRLSESPIEVSPVEKSLGSAHQQHEFSPGSPGLMVDTSSTSEPPVESVESESRSSSPSMIDAETPNDNDQSTNPTTISPHADVPTPSTARSTPTWSDASLRAYMDNDDDIRDLLVIVHDKSNVVPAPDHPFTGNLFSNEKSRLAEMQSSLDSLLNGFLSRKSGHRLPL